MSGARGRRLAALDARVQGLERPGPAVITPPTAPDILAAMTDPGLFGREFGGASWAAWRAFLAAFFGLPLDAAQLAVYQAHTGRTAPPVSASREAWVLAGRRGGKSRVAALIATYLACCRDYARILAAGERGIILLLAADVRQAAVVMSYVHALLERVPALRRLVQQWRVDSVDLRNNVSIEVHAASWRSVRGFTLIGCICDEVSFWRDESSANPDREILDAVRPGLVGVPAAPLLCITTPYAKRGEAYRAFERHYGKDDAPTLIWLSDTVSMNPTVNRQLIEEAFERDPAVAAAEFGRDGVVSFRSDLEDFLTVETIRAITVPGRVELPPRPGVAYVGFTDPAGGSGADAFVTAVAHRDPATGKAVVDALRERLPPFSPADCVQQHAALLRAYGVRRVVGDRWAGGFPPEQFRLHDVTYAAAEQPKSDLYVQFLALANSGQVELLDHRRLALQLAQLERRVQRGGHDSVDHPAGGHDDVANACAGACVVAADRARWDLLPGGFRFTV